VDRFRTMQSFIRVARSSSFTQAAQQLGLSRALVSRHVSDLEARLGARLLNRSTRALVLTEDGREYLACCEQLFRVLAEKEDALSRTRRAPAGTLRMLAPASFGTLLLSDVVIAFAKAHPRLRLTFFLENTWFRQDDFTQRGLDLAIRFAPIRKSALRADPIGSFQWVLVASPDYLANRGRPQAPNDLTHHACLVHTFALADDHMWPFEGSRGQVSVRVQGALYSNSAIMLRNSAIAGLGIALLPRYVAVDALATGELVTVLPRHRPPTRILYAVYPGSAHVPAKTRLFIDFLRGWIDQVQR
jgi:DNA-binding transcriptional LysR family regulator